jgi:hypothetical protein
VLVSVTQLFEAFQRIAWKHGMVQPDRLQHVVHEDGLHTITLTLGPGDVGWTAPKHLTRPGFGASRPTGGEGKKWG